MRNAPANTIKEPRRAPEQIEPDDLRYRLQTSVWVRWLMLITCLVQINYRPDFSNPAYIPTIALAAALVALNGYVHYRLHSNRRVTWHWALALSAVEFVTLTLSILVVRDDFQHTFFVFYYYVLVTFAVVFTSFRLSFAWVTMVATSYVAMSLIPSMGINPEIARGQTLLIRIATMYGAVVVVNLISASERNRRIEAVRREQELRRERIELSRAIHDTLAQSAYMIGLGVETAIELAEDSNQEQIAKLKATHALSKSTMWELRHHIDAGQIFEGQELSRALRSHAATFTTITSIPTDFVQHGDEPDLPVITKGLLFSMAHNAMTNAFRHAEPSRVTLYLTFGDRSLQMAVSDDGIGLPEDYQDRGHGFRNMRSDVERIGGQFHTAQGEAGCGTTVTFTVPYDWSKSESGGK